MIKNSGRKFKYLRNEKGFENKIKIFFIIFQGLSVSKYRIRPKTVLLTMLAIKRVLLCKFAKTLNGRHFMGRSGTGLKFSITADLQIFKKNSYRLLKNISKIPNLAFFCSNFVLYSKGPHFSITRLSILTFCNILHLEINFENLY